MRFILFILAFAYATQLHPLSYPENVGWPVGTLKEVHGFVCKHFKVLNRPDVLFQMGSFGVFLMQQEGPYKIEASTYRHLTFSVTHNEYIKIFYRLTICEEREVLRGEFSRSLIY